MSATRKFGRLTWRSLWLAGELIFVAARFAILFLRRAGRPTRHHRAVCLHHGCRRVLRVFMNHVAVIGPRPRSGLLVSNHLSYLDILLLASIAPCVFVSKHEVKYWPIFGWFATLGGTVFVQRARRGEVGPVAGEIRSLLAAGHLVTLFPEGTSSGGAEILPFKSSLLEAAVGQQTPLFATCIGYSLVDGVVSDDVCYWGDMTLLPHLVNLLMKPWVQGNVRFAEVRPPGTDRKVLARLLHAEVVRLKSLPG